MQKLFIWFAVVTILFAIAFFSEGKVNKNELKVEYYELISTVAELFNDHSRSEGQYYNRSYRTNDEVAQLLDGRVTENGLQQIVYSLFDEYDNLFVYKKAYQEYLSDTLDFSFSENQVSYYSTVNNTILNPALTLVPFTKFEIVEQGNTVQIKANNVKVDFYERGERQSEHHQYARYGFPPSDYISATLTFIVKDGNYLLNDFKIVSNYN